MEPQILDALKTKFVGVDAQILGRVAKKLAKTATTEDQMTLAVEGVTIQSLFESYGDSRATEAQQTAVSTYEKKHGIKDGKVTGGEPKIEPATDPNPSGGGNDLSKQITAAVAAALKPVQDEITALKGDKVSETRKQKLETAIANASDNFKGNIAKDFGRISFKDDDDFDTWLAEKKTAADEDAKATEARGAVFGIPVGGGKGSFASGATEAECDDIARRVIR